MARALVEERLARQEPGLAARAGTLLTAALIANGNPGLP